MVPVDARLIAIVRLRSADGLLRACQELLDAGVPSVEVTLTTPGALDAIQRLGIGAGSVRTPSEARQAQEAGAAFLVTPTIRPQVVAAAQVPVVCGAFTPTEVDLAASEGAAFVKLFPASLGGPRYVREILAPMPDIPLIPTGGVNLSNLADYAAAGAVGVGVGSALADPTLVEARDWASLRQRARAFVQAAATAWPHLA
ncbi:bifunctional 4-hydroxy-2-oxoglutarate aldolase/2-dehydro-3-deoxy-phosphogluconate aldolase [Allorhizocola rhizosphaerae]|uniref:bifunctional 4-hydroxy-2-oxoglutarate aldolase/2-dehydro-3-deoxy-phosphogluconate aldolase n=1 Tax=Allorhizocola rhizosphaerae TaxID=1872709 RepID=UPI000E3EA484|nr:2-dehydro-3-deoxyphosphogluconate aldolase [Allorhizocola rhizosphaerae]